jgi:hypothetical protein
MTRARHEHQIYFLDTTFGDELEVGISRAMSRNGGLDWFTDEQIADIREAMIRREWSRHKLNRENRKRRAAA